MSIESSSSVFPGRIRQFGFIIPDLDAAITQWVNLGVAPWLVVREIHMEGCWYRGEQSSPVISIAFSNSGDMQIELIQQHDDDTEHLPGIRYRYRWRIQPDCLLGRRRRRRSYRGGGRRLVRGVARRWW